MIRRTLISRTVASSAAVAISLGLVLSPATAQQPLEEDTNTTAAIEPENNTKDSGSLGSASSVLGAVLVLGGVFVVFTFFTSPAGGTMDVELKKRLDELGIPAGSSDKIAATSYSLKSFSGNAGTPLDTDGDGVADEEERHRGSDPFTYNRF